jgi:hypothetical protein
MFEPHSLAALGYGKIHIGIYITALKDAINRFEKLSSSPPLDVLKGMTRIKDPTKGKAKEVTGKKNNSIGVADEVEGGAVAVAVAVRVVVRVGVE